jgi:putative alpha-1,2-mannosidase
MKTKHLLLILSIEYSVSNVLGFSHIHAWTMSGLRLSPVMQDFTKADDYPFFLKRSNNWKKQFNPEVKWQMPRDSKGN